MADITDKQMLKLFREVCRLQGTVIMHIREHIKNWTAVCEKKGYTVSRVLKEIDAECNNCQVRCVGKSNELQRLKEGRQPKTQETLKSLNFLDQP